MPPTEILVVDDDLDILDALTELLEDEGYGVRTARSGSEALAVLKSGARPAAMLVDVMMPEMNGVELVQACADDPELASVPALLMSASGTRELERQGVTVFVRKPFTPEKLLHRLAELVAEPLRQAG